MLLNKTAVKETKHRQAKQYNSDIA